MTEEIRLDLIDPNPWQTRMSEDAEKVAALAADIAANELMQVPTLRKAGDRYQIVFGHTRCAAFRHLERETIPANVRDDLTDLQMIDMAVAENHQRNDINPIEEARAMKMYKDHFSLNSEEIGKRFNVSASKVRGTMRLLGLPDIAKEKIADKQINITEARQLLQLQRIVPAAVESLVEDLDEEKQVALLITSRLGRTKGTKYLGYNGQHAPWPLDAPATEFPNNHLVELTKKNAQDVFKLVAVDGAISWSVPLVKMYLDNILLSINFGRDDIEQIDKLAAGDNRSLESLEVVRKLVLMANPPSCANCELYLKTKAGNGLTEQYCGLEVCFNRKKAAWNKKELLDESERTGIAIYEKSDGDYQLLQTWTDGDTELFEQAHPDLRLKRIKTHQSLGFVGDVKVVAVGENYQKRLTPEQADDVDNQAAKLEREEKARQDAIQKERGNRSRDFIYDYAAMHFVAGFEDVNYRVLRIFVELVRLSELPMSKVPEEQEQSDELARFYRNALGFELIYDQFSYDAKKEIVESETTLTTTAEHVKALADEWGVNLPDNFMVQAIEADAALLETT
jgi:ParB/RepB/Spo0J family partition protein